MPTNNLAPKAKNKLGIASSIPPNMAERFGAAVSPYLQGAQALFPPTNPYGQAMSNFLLGQAPQAAQQMAAGYPNVLFNTINPLGGNRIVNPAALDMLGALPVATALKGAGLLAKGAPLVGGITAYHGSPHKFEPTELNDLGEFNAAKIGTGEGAQAYSYGHYTGEARGTGEGYQDMHGGAVKKQSLLELRDKAPTGSAEWSHYDNLAKESGGYLYKVDIPDEHIAQMLDWDKPLRQQPEEIRKILEKVAHSVKTVDTMSREELINTLQYIDRNGSYTDEMMINEFGRPATLDELRESAKMMDVDEYLAENMASDKHATGGSVYKQLVAKFGGGENQSTAAGQVKASELLKKAGIPGVRYLDAGSRGAGEGTSNFVVFPGNEHMMTILERNGQAASPESQAIARYREVKGPKSVVRMEAALRTAGVPLPKNEPVAYIQKLVDRAHRRN